MSGVVVDREQRRLADRRRDPRRRPRRQGPRRRAHRDRPEGRHDHRLGDAGSMTGFMMQRGRQIICGNVGPGLGDSMYDGDDLRRRQGQVARHRLRPRRVDRRRHRARSSASSASTGSATRRSSRSSSAARSSTTTTTSSPPSASWCSEEGVADETAPSQRNVLGHSHDLHARGHQRHPHEGRARPLPDARLLDVQEDPALGRADVPAGHADAVRDRGLPREVRDEDGARRALREEADRARHPRLHHRA